MRSRRHFALILALTVLSVSCKVVRGPAGFWKSYRPEFLTQRQSDQGPWGGERSLAWSSAVPGTFVFTEANRFASRNGWRLVSRAHYLGGGSLPFVQVQKGHQPTFWTYRRRSVSLTQAGFGRIRTNEMTPAFGYVQVSDDGTRMYVHHFWGNG